MPLYIHLSNLFILAASFLGLLSLIVIVGGSLDSGRKVQARLAITLEQALAARTSMSVLIIALSVLAVALRYLA